MLTRRVLRRSLVGAAVILPALLVIGLATGVAVVRRPFPATQGSITLPGLDGQVTVMRDARGVSHVYADSAADLFRAQGYVHAQDRFFEMDWRRHVTSGRLAELMGDDERAIAADRVVRTMGWRRVAEVELEQVDPATRRYLESYARGVNDYLRGRSASQLSMAYVLLGLSHPMSAIEPWAPVDSLAWFKALAWDLRGDSAHEIDRALAYAVVKDVGRVDQLYPTYPHARHTPILPDGSTTDPGANAGAGAGAGAGPRPRSVGGGVGVHLLDGSAQGALARVGAALAAVPTGLAGGPGGDGTGSNSWVVSGALTQTGKPLLANDPHLAPALPGVWYQVALHCRTVSSSCPFDVSGFSFSGVPGVVIGHNARIAWGLDNLGPDVMDVFLERVTGDRVERDGALVPLTVRTETIAVAGAPAQTLTIRTGPHGPLLSDVISPLTAAGQRAPSGRDVVPGRGDGYAVALAWTAQTPAHDMDAVFGINAAGDFAAFRQAGLRLDATAQSLVYADVDGHIGYQAAGSLPLRGTGATGTGGSGSRSGTGTSSIDRDVGGPASGEGAAHPSVVPSDGTWPLPGWTSAHDWKGYAVSSDLPSALDPREGFVVAANQAVTPPGGRATLSRTSGYGYRSHRIRDLLSTRSGQGEKLTVTDMEAVQADTHNGMAAELVPLLLAAKIDDPFYAQGVRLLRGWNGDQPTDSAAAAFFNAVWASLLESTFNDELPEGSRPDGGGRWFEVVRILLKDPDNLWWDDRGTPSVVETRDEIIKQAAIHARDRLTRSLGKDPTSWTWGRLHRLALTQTPFGTSSRTAVLYPLLNEGPVEMPGGTSIVNALGWDASNGNFRVTSAPSMRMVVDLGDLDRSRWANQTGQSGHPGSDHYLDQLDAWRTGRTFPWPSAPDAVRAATEQTLTLTPATSLP